MNKLVHKEKRLFAAVALAFALLLAACSLGAPGKAFALVGASSVDDPVQVAQIEQQVGERQGSPSTTPPQVEADNIAAAGQTAAGSMTGEQAIAEPSSSPAPTPDSAAKPEQTIAPVVGVPATGSNDEAGSEPTQPTDLPKLTGFVIVSGNTKVGTTLVAGVEGAPEGVSLVYQWYRGESAIPGATANAYTTTIADNNCDISCKVSAEGYTGILVSGGIRPTAPAEPLAFAVYSDDDKSFNFYKRSSVPNAGDTFEGKTVTAVYVGIETDVYNIQNLPWTRYTNRILSASIVDDGITPLSTAFWFSDFAACSSIDLSKLDTSKVINMNSMFIRSAVSSLDVNHFDTSKVMNMSWMFASCESLTSLNLANWDTSNVTDMMCMFVDLKKISVLDLRGFDTSKVTTMFGMFEGCETLTSLNVMGWNTSSVIDMTEMFYGCINLAVLDVSSFMVSESTDTSLMFAYCPELVTIYVDPQANWSDAKVSEVMFGDSFVLVGGLGTAYEEDKDDGTYALVDGLDGKPGYFTPKIMVSYYDPETGTISIPVLYKYGITAAQGESEGFWGWALTPDATKPAFLPGELVLYDSTNITDLVLYPVKKPYLVGYVVISGSTKVGSTLTATVEAGPADVAFTYQWYRGDAPIEGATACTYTTTNADNNCDISCKVSAASYQGELVSGVIRPFSPVTPPQTITVEYWSYTDVSPEAQVLLKSETAKLTDFFDCRYDQNKDDDDSNDRVPYKLLGWQLEGQTDYYDIATSEDELSIKLADIASLISWDGNTPLVFHAVHEVRQITVHYWGNGYEEGHYLEPVKVMSWFDTPYLEGIVWKGYQLYGQVDDSISNIDSTMTCGDILSRLVDGPWLDELNIYFDWWAMTYEIHFFEPDDFVSVYDVCFDESLVLPMYGSGFYPGHEFIGWFTESDGSGMQVLDGMRYCDIQPDDTIKRVDLYAFFEQLDLTGSVQISGGINVGDTLTATVSNAPADAQLQYQWYRGNSLIEEATGTTYVLVGDDAGAEIMCEVRGLGYKDILSSNAVGPITGMETHVFAIFSTTDNSLNFYRRSALPTVGEMFSGRYATAVYTDFEDSGIAPWAEYSSIITNVTVVDRAIQTTRLDDWFAGFTNCISINLGNLDTSKATTMLRMFHGCSNLTSLDVSGFVTTRVSNMSAMFFGCSKLTSLDLSLFDLTHVNSMTKMFQNCSLLESLALPVSGTPRITSLIEVFRNCSSLVTLDLSGIDVAKNPNATRMLAGCTSLTTIYSSPDTDWSGIENSIELFHDCHALIGGNGTEFDPDSVDASCACVDGLNGKQGYFTAKPAYNPEKRVSAGEANLLI